MFHKDSFDFFCSEGRAIFFAAGDFREAFRGFTFDRNP